MHARVSTTRRTASAPIPDGASYPRPGAASTTPDVTAEHRRLRDLYQRGVPWRRFGPYLADRQWGTVREDYSATGDAWGYFTHDDARSRAYRWGEDGIAGLSDDQQRLCLGVALWNGADPIIKERLFGLTGHEGNHGEDVKELYYFLDATPTHSYLKMLYKYPQGAFPYEQLLRENRLRGRHQEEYEITDTGAFEDDRYFDVFVEYAKASPEELVMRVRVVNRGPDAASIVVLPQIWFRNTWSWEETASRPSLRARDATCIDVRHPTLGDHHLHADTPDALLFCENDTNASRLFGAPRGAGYFKDGINDFVVHGDASAVNPQRQGTKAAALYRFGIPSHGERMVTLHLTKDASPYSGAQLDAVLTARAAEADDFYASLHPSTLSPDERLVQRQAWAGMLWSQQFYHFDVPVWLAGDPGQPPPPHARRTGRNALWGHLNCADIVSMPDTWEYPWFAAWDLAFHAVPLAALDAELAKEQLLLLAREWYMHPNGQLPAYEWAFGDVNPPVHAWAALRVFEIDRARRGDAGDIEFLERMLHKLMLNFTWWVNRKDAHGRNLFQGGFLGLDNIGIFDRSARLPLDAHLEQADGTAWMAMYAAHLLRMALALALHRPAYEDIASKFFEHFLYIAGAMRDVGGEGITLWHEHDGFFYDVLHCDSPERTICQSTPLRVRSMVGLVPLFAVAVLDSATLARLPGFRARMHWFLEHRPALAAFVSRTEESGTERGHLLSVLSRQQLTRVLRRVLDEAEFLSPFGVRSLSKAHERMPFVVDLAGEPYSVGYEPGESASGLFGGNSNWRGPVWFPVNFLLIDALRTLAACYGDGFRVEYPTGSGHWRSLAQVADALVSRLVALFVPATDGARPCFGTHVRFRDDPHFRGYLLFHEYFHGDTGRGLGASHQTGWTGLVATLLNERQHAD